MSQLFNFFKSDKYEKKDSSQLKGKNLKDMNLVVKKNRCPQNHICPSIRVCPVGALTQKGFAAPVVDEEKCIKCGKCARFCPMGALALEA